MKVDIDQILRDKNPKAARLIPGFLKSYLKRIVHEKEVNYYLGKYAHLPHVEFIRTSLAEMGIGYGIEGLDELPGDGRYIFAANHPFGGLDGVMLADKVHQRFGDVRVIVNDILMNMEPLSPIFIPVNKHGRQNTEYLQMYKDAFASDIPIITFPAGLCSRRHKGVVEDLVWKPNFVKQAITHDRQIVPVYFEGSLSNFFYRLSNFRTRIGLKVNIEMLYLVDEMFKQQGQNFTIRVGKPIPPDTLKEKRVWETAAEIRKIAYNLKNQ